MLRFAVLVAVLLAASAASSALAAARSGDEFDAAKWATDAAMPAVRRGLHDERVHYQSTIGTNVQWVSACIASAELAEQAMGPKDSTTPPHVKASIGTTPWRGMTRDAAGKHTYASASASSSSSSASSNWLSPSSPLGFQSVDHARRNPAQACVFSASFRESHATLCSGHNIDSLKRSAAPTQMQPPFQPSSFKLVPGKDTTCAAWGWFDAGMLTSGWNYLYVESNPLLLDAVQARALGFLEGALTVQQISEHKLNEFQTLFGDDSTPDPLTIGFVQDMTNYMLNSSLASPTDPYWQQVGLQYQQIQGIYEGLSAVNPDPSRAPVNYFDLILLQYDGDMSDIQGALGLNPVPTPESSLQTIMEYLTLNGHCSALVKLLPNQTELFVAHDTWAGFSSTHRMWKVYNLPLHMNQSTSTVSFSSYPGYIISTDDWYQTKESQLVVLETTNDIVNATLYTLIDSATVPAWTRTMVATRLAGGGEEWTSLFGEYNSGTYNNQWMCLDFSVFTPGSAVIANTLWILEVMPGSVYSRDVSSTLAAPTAGGVGQGYWASYNRPFFPEVYTAMGYAGLNATYGPYLFGYSEYFRAGIFRREQSNITTLAGMQHTMSLNEWQTDPWSRNNSGFAISSRFDLSTYDPLPWLEFFYRGAWGAYDVKITMSSWMQMPALTQTAAATAPVASTPHLADDSNVMRVSTISGPTHQDQPVFTWLDPEWSNYANHFGLPDTYDFTFLQFHQ